GAPTLSLTDTAHVLFPSSEKLPADAPAGYKSYTLLALLFFLQEKNMEHAQYIQKSFTYWGARETQVPTVSFLDRRDLLDYLTGVSDSSAYVKDVSVVPSVASAGQKRPREEHASKSSKGGPTVPDQSEEGEVLKKLKATMEVDYDLIKDSLLARERTIINLNNFMSAKSTKPFTYALKYAGELLRPAQAPAVVPGAKSGSKTVDPKTRPPHPSSSSRPPAPSSAPQKDSRGSMKPPPVKPAGKPSPNAKIPIIIVPPSISAVITLYNVKRFLGDMTFQSTDEAIKEQGEKPGMVIVDRKNAPPGFPKQYHVYDSVDRLKPDDWDRIVAVFATGQEWQFKGWKFGPPVNIFAKVRGFCLKYIDEPIHEKIKTWNVVQLN
ncbi:UNVERIFIED_CONTAM: hypothetical protein HDU68_005481, partial [Siphonaria sp. JEL0065]